MGLSDRDWNTKMNVVGQAPCGPSVCYDVDGPGVFILGGCHHSHTPPLTYSAPRFWILFFFIDVVFLFAHDPLHPVPSCYFDLRFKIQYLFSPLNMILWHNSVSCRKEPDLFSKHCAQTLQKKKNSYGCNICIPDLWFKGKKKKKSLQCFFPCFLIGGMTKQDWNLNYASPAWRHVSLSALARPGEGVLLLLSLCCMLNTHHLPLCILPPASCLLLLLLLFP